MRQLKTLFQYLLLVRDEPAISATTLKQKMILSWSMALHLDHLPVLVPGVYPLHDGPGHGEPGVGGVPDGLVHPVISQLGQGFHVITSLSREYLTRNNQT